MRKTILVALAVLGLGCGDASLDTGDGGLCIRDRDATDNPCGPGLGEGACLAYGGTFSHPSPFRTVCLCPARDGNCPCTSSTECEGYCELREATTVDQCSYATGLCTPFRRFSSCACILGESAVLHIPAGQAQMVCVE